MRGQKGQDFSSNQLRRVNKEIFIDVFQLSFFWIGKLGMCFFCSNVHILGKVLRCLCFFMEIAGFFILNWMMST